MGRRSLYPEHVKHQAVLMMRTMTGREVVAKLDLTSVAVIHYWRRSGYGVEALAVEPEGAEGMAPRRAPRNAPAPRRPPPPPAPRAEPTGPTVRCPICKELAEVERPCDVVARRMAFTRHFTRSPECEQALRRAAGDPHRGVAPTLA